ncbi:helix-turn-helix domain-containing protein [Tenacibaculum ascidiaceicola]|uniref:helix-turn-helix domain-containing protein n=1 Tax=Tenacibaculum ascidiaceicola TaxID=1699411 RepID=UPI0039E70D07
MKSNKSNIKSINSIIFKENKFSAEEEEGWCRVYVDLLEYKNSKTIWTVYFSHVYCDLLYKIGEALGMSHLFSFVPHDSVIDNIIFYGEKTKKIKNKELIIRQSAYLQYIVKTYENNNYDIFNSSSIHAIFAYDDIKIIEIVRNVIVEFLIKSSSLGISERVRIFIEITGEALKVKKENDFLIQDKSSSKEKVEVVKNVQPIIDKDLLTRNEAKDFLNISLPTLNNWTKKGMIKSYGIGGRVYYKKNEILELLEELK